MQIGDSPLISVFSAGLSGIERNLESFRKSVEKITRTAPLGDLPRDLVELTVSQRGAEASMATVRAADEMVGTILDVLA